MFSPGGLNTTLLSHGCTPERVPRVGTVAGTYIPRTGRGVESPSAWVQLVGQQAVTTEEK